MKKSNSLLQTRKPYLDECLSGYILRLTQINYYDSPTWIARLANFSQYSFNANLLVKGTHDLYPLSEITKVAEDVLWSMTFSVFDDSPESTYVQAFGNLLSPYFLKKKVAKVCPSCLHDSPYCRKVWNLSFATVCPIHSCLLIDECPKCGSTINWLRSKVCECKKCGFDWRDFVPEHLPSHEVALCQHLYNLCSLHTSSNLITHHLGTDNPILKLGLNSLITLLCFIAGQFISISDSTGKFVGTIRKNDELHALLIKAYLVFKDFPNELYNFFAWKRTVNSAHERDTGVAREFGSFYKKLYEDFSRETFPFLHVAFETYLAEHWDGGYFNAKLGRIRERKVDKVFVSGVEAAKLLGVREEWIVKFIEQNKLEGTLRKMGERRLILVKKASLTLFKEKMSSAISLEKAAQILAVGEKTVLDLIKYSCFQVVRGPEIDGHAQWLVDAKSIVDLLAQLDSQVKLVTAQSTSRILFPTALRKLTGLGYTTGRLVRLILDGGVHPCSKDSELGLNRYVFLEKDIEQLIQQSVNASKENFITVVDVAKMLGVKQGVAAFWMDKGLIACEREVGKKRCKRKVPRRSINLFKETFISAVDISKLMNTSPKHSVEILMSQNVMPATGPRVDGGRQYLFRRDDITPFLKTV